MPVYEFDCKACGNRFVLSMSVDEMEKGKLRCPRCNDQAIEMRMEPVFVKTSRKS